MSEEGIQKMKNLRVAKGGIPIIVSSFATGVAILMFYSILKLPALIILSTCVLVFTTFTTFFFRDPERMIGDDIVSPADGRILKISQVEDRDIGRCVSISIFMSLFDVHVNRIPVDGKILKVVREKGAHHPAYTDKSYGNEKNTLIIHTDIGKIKVIQIAGLIARRIVCYVKEGDNLKKGERIGIIRFGSRVDLLLPENRVSVVVKEGEFVKAGADTIAKINA